MCKYLAFKQWRNQPKNWGGQKILGDKMFDFRRMTLFCLEKSLSKHKMTTFSKYLRRGMAPLAPPGYAYAYKGTTSSNMNA